MAKIVRSSTPRSSVAVNKARENVAAARGWLEESHAIRAKHLTTVTQRLDELEEELDSQQVEHERVVADLKREHEAELKRAQDEAAAFQKSARSWESQAKQNAARLQLIGAEATRPLSDGSRPDGSK